MGIFGGLNKVFSEIIWLIVRFHSVIPLLVILSLDLIVFIVIYSNRDKAVFIDSNLSQMSPT